MEQDSKQKISKSNHKFLTTELARLQSLGVLSPEKVEEISGLYAPRAASGSYLNKVFLVLLLLGVTAFGLSVYSALGEFWSHMSKTARLVTAVAPFILSYVGYAIARRKKSEIATKSTLFAGSFFFFLCAAYLAGECEPQKLELCTLWFIGALATFTSAFFSKSRSLHTLAVFFIVCWISATVAESDSYYRAHTCEALFHDHSCFFTLAFVALGSFWSYRRAAQSIGLLYLLLLAFWQGAQLAVYSNLKLLAFNVIFIGASMLLVEAFYRRKGVIRWSIRWLGYALILITLPITTYESIYDYSRYYSSIYSHVDRNVPTFISLGIALAAAIGLLVLAKRRASGIKDERSVALRAISAATAPEALCLTALPIYLAAHTQGLDSDGIFLCAVWANVLMCALALRLVVRGGNGRPFEFIVGIIYFVVWLVMRMFALVDWFGGDDNYVAILFFLAVSGSLFAFAFGLKKCLRKEPQEPERAEEEIAERAPQDVVPNRACEIGIVTSIVAQFIIAAAIPFI